MSRLLPVGMLRLQDTLLPVLYLRRVGPGYADEDIEALCPLCEVPVEVGVTADRCRGGVAYGPFTLSPCGHEVGEVRIHPEDDLERGEAGRWVR